MKIRPQLDTSERKHKQYNRPIETGVKFSKSTTRNKNALMTSRREQSTTAEKTKQTDRPTVQNYGESTSFVP
jgi:hypothetical protein